MTNNIEATRRHNGRFNRWSQHWSVGGSVGVGSAPGQVNQSTELGADPPIVRSHLRAHRTGALSTAPLKDTAIHPGRHSQHHFCYVASLRNDKTKSSHRPIDCP